MDHEIIGIVVNLNFSDVIARIRIIIKIVNTIDIVIVMSLLDKEMNNVGSVNSMEDQTTLYQLSMKFGKKADLWVSISLISKLIFML